ncbi:MAG: extracellular solute-binding protein [Oscillospiraceae bacterium]|nr:extracellular solute-binding protein [Oscillospiraceae bacterium]
MKKVFTIALALITLASFRCNASAEETPVTITFWHTYGDAEAPVIDELIVPMFEAVNPGLKVEAVRQSGDFNQMLVAALGAGVVPDAARVDITKTSAYAKLGGIVAMDEIEGFAALKDAVLEGPLSTNLWNGRYYGLPLNTSCKAAVVNLEQMRALGFNGAPATMEEFIAAAMEKAPGEYKLSVSGLGDWDMYPYFWLFGGALTDEGFTKASGYLDSAASVDAIKAIQQMHDGGVFTIRDVDGTPDAWDGINSQYAMFFEGPWYPFSDSVVPATIPSYNGRSVSIVGGENIVIFSGSDEKEAAFTFARFMLSEEAQLKLLEVGVLPALKSCVESEAVRNDPKWSVYMNQLSSAKSRILTPQASTVEQLWSDAMSMIFLEGADVWETLAMTAAEIDYELAK